MALKQDPEHPRVWHLAMQCNKYGRPSHDKRRSWTGELRKNERMLHQNYAARVAAGFAFLVSYLKLSLKSMPTNI